MKKTVEADKSGRLDVILSEAAGLTRSRVKQLLEGGSVLVDGVTAKKCGQTVKPGSSIEVDVPEPVSKIEGKEIPVEILYEDSDIAVINKPQGLTVHPAGRNYTDTLVNALMFKLDSLSGINGEIRPGIVHRLDKDTSGVMVVAKNDAAHLSLSSQISQRSVKKEYLALLEGRLSDDEGVVNTGIARSARNRKLMEVNAAGREAVTEYKVLRRFSENSLVLFRILTGRTHQIRVHAKYLGHPVVGDKSYGYKKQKFALDGQLLHAYRLSFNHPSTGERLVFTAPLPDYFIKVLDVLADKNGQRRFDPDKI
ncbi:MAG: RluA family pseudouridine synthase [Christensenellales bacterium]|jgi:pseudouridine synthase, rluA family